MLIKGDRGPAVLELQNILIARGHAITADGIFGPATEQAVRRVQAKYGLSEDGIVGPKTMAVLKNKTSAPSVPKHEAEEPEIAATPADQAYPEILKFCLNWEGGYGNDPDDPGGATNFGIIQREYDSFRRARGLATRSVRFIEKAEYEAIYRRNYWAPMRCSELPPAIAAAVFDYAVNAGKGRPSKELPTILLTSAKSVGFYDETIRRANAHVNPVAVALRLIIMREQFYMRLARKHPYDKFLKGWLNRTAALRTFIKKKYGN